MSPGLAKMMIADEINRQLSQPLKEKWHHVRLRIKGPDQLGILTALHELAPGKVITARWLGPRDDEDETVLYATLKCDDISDLTRIISGLEELAFEVRDGAFGLFIR
jgi:hypothetical protein